jgi:hypothetical protein
MGGITGTDMFVCLFVDYMMLHDAGESWEAEISMEDREAVDALFIDLEGTSKG